LPAISTVHSQLEGITEMPAGITPPAQPRRYAMNVTHLTLPLKILTILELLIKALVIFLTQ